jgi:RimJ/RimL family protein N-acetyltransferase
MAAPAPTPRLIIREFTDADLTDLAGLLSDSDVMHFSWCGPIDREASADVLARFQRLVREHGFGKWALTLRSTGEFVGYCGLEPTPRGAPAGFELGYRLLPRFWGQGIATEAAAAVVTHVFATTGLGHIHAFVDPANFASVRVLETAGFHRVQAAAVLNGKTLDIYRYERPVALAKEKA